MVSAPIAIPRPSSPALISGRQKVKELVPTEGAWKLVPMREEHLEDVLRIQRACYEPEYREDTQSYIDRMRLFPQGNAVLLVPDPAATSISPSTPPSPSSPAASKKRRKDPKWLVAGYILVQPFYRGATNDVNDVKLFSRWISERDRLPRTHDDAIYIHELSIHPDFRGQGLTRPLTDYVEAIARDDNFKWLTLVALGSALAFWKRTGYTLLKEIDYGGHICYYMEKPSGLP